ncbi:hypothetical protein B0H19DRAFT_1232533 [Mycena capillaripes]|nr:hypothetical protein B0H19DRAFT_1232533 [Mycena capillaripes]
MVTRYTPLAFWIPKISLPAHLDLLSAFTTSSSLKPRNWGWELSSGLLNMLLHQAWGILASSSRPSSANYHQRRTLGWGQRDTSEIYVPTLPAPHSVTLIPFERIISVQHQRLPGTSIPGYHGYLRYYGEAPLRGTHFIYVPLDEEAVPIAIVVPKHPRPHTHPPSPPTKITTQIRRLYEQAVRAYGTSIATVNKVEQAPSTLQIMGKAPTLVHPSLLNMVTKQGIITALKRNELGGNKSGWEGLDQEKEPSESYIHSFDFLPHLCH